MMSEIKARRLNAGVTRQGLSAPRRARSVRGYDGGTPGGNFAPSFSSRLAAASINPRSVPARIAINSGVAKTSKLSPSSAAGAGAAMTAESARSILISVACNEASVDDATSRPSIELRPLDKSFAATFATSPALAPKRIRGAASTLVLNDGKLPMLSTVVFPAVRGMITWASHFGSGAASELKPAQAAHPMPSPNEILAELKKVKYPGFTRDIVSFGIVKDIEVAHAGVTVMLGVASAKPEVAEKIAAEVKAAVAAMPGVPAVKIQIEQAPQPAQRAAAVAQPRTIPGVKHIVAVASGKGGVGKSTVAVNLALAMRALGWRIGLMDADVYGPSVAMMVGVEKAPTLTPERRIIPLERYGIRYISMALFINDETAVIWRGPMVTKLETEFLFNVEWGELDCLVLDLPPGTGDAQLTITQRVALDGGVIVTTPQEIALLDVKRGVAMFEEVHVPVLGVVENMSYYLCPKCHHRHEIFAHGGGARLADSLHVPFLGELPLVRELREGGDHASPLVASNPAHPVSAAFKSIAAKVIEGLDKSEVQHAS